MFKKRCMAFVLAITMAFGLFSTISFAAAKTYKVVDMNKKAQVTSSGVSASTKEVKSSKYSAEWKMDDMGALVYKDIDHDFSNYSKISFSAKLVSTGNATILFSLHSENNSTDGIDYYSKSITVKPGEWTDYEFDFSELTTNRTPKGYNNIDSITLHGVGWDNKHAEGAIMYIDGFTLSGEPTDIKSDPSAGTSSDPASGGKRFTENDTDIGEKMFFNGMASGANGLGINKKTNLIEVRKDSGDENYIYFETLDTASDYHLDCTISEPTRFMVAQMKLAYKGSCVNGNIQYKDLNKLTVSVMDINNGEVTLAKQPFATLNKKGNYTDIALIFDFAKNTVSGYVNGEEKIKDAYITSPDKDAISMLRLYMGTGNETGSNLSAKDYVIYEGNAIREISKDETGPRIGKISKDNSAAIKILGNDVVAIAVGGNGIYYKGGKHDIDAPAFIKDDRTLVPVRAISEAFGLKVDWDDATGTVTIDDKSKIVIGSTEMILPDGSGYTLDVPADTYNDRTFLPLRALCEKILGKVVSWDDRGLIVIGDKEFSTSESNVKEAFNYLLYDRPTAEQITEMFTAENNNVHPRIMINPERYKQIKYNYANDEFVKKWGDNIIASADKLLTSPMPEYVLPDNYRLLSTSRSVYERSKTLSMAYILTEDKKYSDYLYKIFQAAGSFPNWNPQHFLDIGEMTCAFSIGYDWLYDVWTDEQKKFLEDTIYNYGLVTVEKAYYNQLGTYGWWTPNNDTNWNVVCNGGMAMGAIALFDKYPKLCSDLLQMQIRDVEAMMNSFYPDGAWFEGIGYWTYTLDYTVNMISTLQACFNTDFNLTKAPGFDKTIYFSMAGDGPVSINTYHDTGDSGHQNSSSYFWLSNQFNIPGVTNVRLYNMQEFGWSGSPFDILWYDTSIKGTDFDLAKDTYLRDVEFVAMRNSWVDPEGAWLSYHAGKAVVNHSHLDTGSFIVDLLGQRWATDLGSDDYNMEGYFSSNKHVYYRLRPEGHNLYVINPSEYEGQDTNSFCKVENGVVSKPRGAYSIADLTPAYSRDVTSARRGYMLGDDRRSAIIRDEITFKGSDDNDFYWFSHMRAGTTFEIIDNKTIILTQGGRSVKVMVDTDIPDYELAVVDAVPLPTSPVRPAQNQNKGIKKISIHGKASGSKYVQVKFIPVEDVNADKPFENIKLDDWTIPDGELKPMPIAPTLTSISRDGESLSVFNPKSTSYNITLAYGTTDIPVITAGIEDDCELSCEQSQSFDTPTIIKVWRKGEPDVVRTCTITYELLPKLEDVNGYTRLQVSSHLASEEPEAEHPASQVSNNDTSADSRWAAEGRQWVQIDLGSVKDVNAAGLSWWKGDERKYTFNIEFSADGTNFEPVLSERQSSGASAGFEVYDFGKTVSARYLRYNGSGNSANQWNSVTEFAALIK